MSILRLADGRMYEMRENARELFDLLFTSVDKDAWLYLNVRQPGRKSGHYKGLLIPLAQVESIEDDGLGHAAVRGDQR